MPNPSDAFAGSSRTEHSTSRGGVDVFRRWWDADDGHASALILHGIAEHSGRYEHVGSTLAAAGYQTLAFDHHGFGRSGGRRGHVDRFDVYLDDVEDQLAELREADRPVVLLGHSMGGLIAFRYCTSARPLPDVLLLTGPALGAEAPTWQRVLAPVLGRIAPNVFITSEFDGSLLATDPDVGDVYEADPLRVKGATARLGMELFDNMKIAAADVPKLSIPTMVAHGGADRIVPVDFSAPIGARPLASRIVLDGLEHEVLNEPSWADTMAALIQFANEHLSASSATA